MEPEDNQWLDEYLNDALAQYGKGEPRPGIENRILSTLRAEEARAVPPHRWKWMALAACSAVAILVFIAIGFNERRTQQPVIVIQQSVPTNAVPHVAHEGAQHLDKEPQLSSPVRLATRSRKHEAQRSGSAVRKQAQFPSPKPLTEQQKLLLAYLRNTPEDELLTVVKKENDYSDLRIVDLRVQPLSDEPSWLSSHETR